MIWAVLGSYLKAYILEATKIGMPSMNYLIADVIQFVSGTMTSFSRGDATKIKSMNFAEFGSQTTIYLKVRDQSLTWNITFCMIL